MPNDHYRHVAFSIQRKTLERIDKLAAEFGLSRANTLVTLIEQALIAHGEPIEVSTTNTNGVRRANNTAGVVANGLRKIL